MAHKRVITELRSVQYSYNSCEISCGITRPIPPLKNRGVCSKDYLIGDYGGRHRRGRAGDGDGFGVCVVESIWARESVETFTRRERDFTVTKRRKINRTQVPRVGLSTDIDGE